MEGKSHNLTDTRIESLQALRALAFLGIFFSHSGFFISWPNIGVSVFYVMSGFLMIYTYGEREFDIKIKNNFEFSVHKIKKLYPLHIITMICVAVTSLASIIHNGIGSKSIADFIGKIILNITLTQTWVPDSNINTSLNGVAWYLSVTLFLYFVFPLLAKVVRDTKTQVLCVICVIILVIEIFLCIPFIKVFGLVSPVYIWFMYCFPVFRLGDFFIGCVLGKIYKHINISNIGMVTASVCEVIATAATVFVYSWLKRNHTNIVLQAIHNWTTVFIPLAAMWVFLFTINKGVITKIFSNKLFIYIGNISMYAFLIHYVVTLYTWYVLNFLDIDLYGKGMLVLFELILSVLLSEIYRRIHDKHEKTIKQKEMNRYKNTRN